MLILVDIKKKDACTCIVTLNRDGKEMVYEFDLHIPDSDHPDRIPSIGAPEEAYFDLIDYNIDFPQSKSKGAICIPFMNRLCNLAYRVGTGKPVELPQVLDER